MIDAQDSFEIPVGDIEPGEHSISVLLDSFNEETSCADVSNIQFKITPIVEYEVGDLDKNGVVDLSDITFIQSYRNQPASSCPDGGGTITVLDARKLMMMCTHPRCASSN